MSLPKLAAATLLMTVATIGWSQSSPEDHAAHHPPEVAQAPARAGVMPGRATTESTADLAVSRGLIDKAEHAKTAAERERLLDEHLAAMRHQLAKLKSQECAMEEMGGAAKADKSADGTKPAMMGEGMQMGDGAMGNHMMMCHEMMKARMETMADLLEQTWRREELRKKGAK